MSLLAASGSLGTPKGRDCSGNSMPCHSTLHTPGPWKTCPLGPSHCHGFDPLPHPCIWWIFYFPTPRSELFILLQNTSIAHMSQMGTGARTALESGSGHGMLGHRIGPCVLTVPDAQECCGSALLHLFTLLNTGPASLGTKATKPCQEPRGVCVLGSYFYLLLSTQNLEGWQECKLACPLGEATWQYKAPCFKPRYVETPLGIRLEEKETDS